MFSLFKFSTSLQGTTTSYAVGMSPWGPDPWPPFQMAAAAPPSGLTASCSAASKYCIRIGESALQLSQSGDKVTGEHRQNPKEQ